MKVIVISDTHLTAKFDEQKFNFLLNLFRSCDKLVVNGDLWNCYSSTFDEFLNSDWNRLFPIMLSKSAAYIYGNHDRKEFMDERVSLFSKEQHLKMELTVGGGTFHVEHGHLFFKHQSTHTPGFMKVSRKLKIDERIRHPLEQFLYKTIGADKLFKFSSFMNAQVKSRAKEIFNSQKILVVGHTHVPECDKELGFVNTGFIDQGLAWYLEINGRGYKLNQTTY